MKCPKCFRDSTKVRLTIPFVEGKVPKVVRERICTKCDHVFHSLETPEDRPEETPEKKA